MTSEVRNELVDGVLNSKDEELLNTLKVIKDHSSIGDWLMNYLKKVKNRLNKVYLTIKKGRF